MAIKRDKIENSFIERGQTGSPLDNEKNTSELVESRTSDSFQIAENYISDSKTSKGQVFTGAVIPKDMTVKLVRADSANWEILLSSLYSLTLTFFGILLGAWLTDTEKNTQTFSLLEKVCTIFLLFISVVLIVIWVIIKIKQSRKGVIVSEEELRRLGNK